MVDANLIELDGITKRFGGVTALDGVSFGVRRGEVHAIVGENGAGKSTLMKLLAGVHQQDAGELRLDGQSTRLRSPRDARRQGISIVFQELNLLPDRSVAANVFVGREQVGRFGIVDRRAMRQATRRALDELQVSISPETRVGELSVGEQQLVEIAGALAEQSRIIILDEPNSALGESESLRLFEIIRRLRERGITILYVSHRLEEVFAMADRISVIRDGKFQGTWRASETNPAEIVAAMIGRRLEQLFPPRQGPKRDAPLALEVRALCGKRLGSISFTARAGEIIGFAGLEGSGVNELFDALFGLGPATAGEVIDRGETRRFGSPGEAIRHGWGLIPASRRDQGLFVDWSISRNAALVALDRLVNRLGLVDGRRIAEMTAEFIRRLNISTTNQATTVTHLSGGNQQKVLLAKWLAIGPRVLILNDPTRGVDVGAKWEIYELCQQLAAQGLVILLSSSELDEVLGLADRVLAMAKGRVTREFHHGEATKTELMHAIAGANEPQAAT